MISRKLSTVVVAGALLSCAGWGIAAAQAPGDTPAVPGRLYALHTAAVGKCPALDWHVIVGEDRTLDGMIGTNNMKTLFHVSGTFDPVMRTFHLEGDEVGGGTRIGAINGTFDQQTFTMVATLNGMPGGVCDGTTLRVKWLSIGG